MKVYMKPIRMISMADPDGKIRPLRFQIEGKDGRVTANVDRIISAREEKLAGNRMRVYDCQSVVGNQERRFELKYDIAKCKWFLYKM